MKLKIKMIMLMVAFFCLCAGVLLWVKVNSEQTYKKIVVQARLDAYCDMVAAADTLSEVKKMLPSELQVAILDLHGRPLYEADMQNLDSPDLLNSAEVRGCKERKEGCAVRLYKTDHGNFLCYAKLFEDKIVHLSLPYEVNMEQYFHPDWTQLLIIIAFFVLLFVAVLLYSSRYEQKLRKVSEKKTRELKHQMTGNIAHELKTPVSSIRGYLETLVENPDISDENRTLFIERSYVQSLRLSELINDIALITKMEEVPEQFSKEPVALKNVADIVFEEFHAKLEQVHILVENCLPEEMIVLGNFNLIYAIFRNLVENTVKYAGQECKIHIEGKQTDKQSMIVYYDTGAGVPEEQQKHIFDRFYRVHGKHGEGSGLGLSIVRNAVLFHGGTIHAYNNIPAGLRFEITL